MANVYFSFGSLHPATCFSRALPKKLPSCLFLFGLIKTLHVCSGEKRRSSPSQHFIAKKFIGERPYGENFFPANQRAKHLRSFVGKKIFPANKNTGQPRRAKECEMKIEKQTLGKSKSLHHGERRRKSTNFNAGIYQQRLRNFLCFYAQHSSSVS